MVPLFATAQICRSTPYSYVYPQRSPLSRRVSWYGFSGDAGVQAAEGAPDATAEEILRLLSTILTAVFPPIRSDGARASALNPRHGPPASWLVGDKENPW
uniref:Uncharacterized protein n=1 Tax=Arundo donax TaxID=35708 RepID=A0A0A9P8F7_ARUDO